MARLTAAQLQTLKNEITTDLKELGYSGESSQWVADKLNEVGASNETIDRGVIDSHEVVSACVINELNALTDKQQSILSFIVSAGQVNTSDDKIKSIFADLFGAATTTRANLLALESYSCSRAEALGLPIIYFYHVEQALLP